jgi:hypothetical protein
MKQLIYTGDFSPQELETYKALTVINILQITQQILAYVSKNNMTEISTE